MGDHIEIEDTGGVVQLAGRLFDRGATVGDVLTVQADESIAAAPGGGGAGGMQVAVVPISSAEVKALFTTPVILVPGVADRIIVVCSATLAYIAGGTPYTDHGGNIMVETETDEFEWLTQAGAGFWDQAASQFFLNAGVGAFGPGAVTDAAGLGVILTEDTANPTAGDGTLVVTLAYYLGHT